MYRKNFLITLAALLVLISNAGAALCQSSERQEELRDEPIRSNNRKDNSDSIDGNLSTAIHVGVQLFNNGDFDKAISVLNAANLIGEPGSKQAEALKYIAFCYCVTRRPDECRHSFELAFIADKNFSLAPGEPGHPMWGPVFNQVHMVYENSTLLARKADENARAQQAVEIAQAQEAETRARVREDSDRERARLTEKRLQKVEQIRTMELWQNR